MSVFTQLFSQFCSTVDTCSAILWIQSYFWNVLNNFQPKYFSKQWCQMGPKSQIVTLWPQMALKADSLFTAPCPNVNYFSDQSKSSVKTFVMNRKVFVYILRNLDLQASFLYSQYSQFASNCVLRRRKTKVLDWKLDTKWNLKFLAKSWK